MILIFVVTLRCVRILSKGVSIWFCWMPASTISISVNYIHRLHNTPLARCTAYEISHMHVELCLCTSLKIFCAGTTNRSLSTFHDDTYRQHKHNKNHLTMARLPPTVLPAAFGRYSITNRTINSKLGGPTYNSLVNVWVWYRSRRACIRYYIASLDSYHRPRHRGQEWVALSNCRTLRIIVMSAQY